MLLRPKNGDNYLCGGTIRGTIPNPIRSSDWQGTSTTFVTSCAVNGHLAIPGAHRDWVRDWASTVVMNELSMGLGLLIASCYRSRQDAIEALALAALGKVHCHYALRRLEELETYVCFCVVG